MAELNIFRVMVLTYTSLTISLTLASITFAAICPEKQYLNAKLQLCINCTECHNKTVVLRPCEQHRDTICGPMSVISDLLKSISPTNPHRHHHEKHLHTKNHHNHERLDTSDTSVSSEAFNIKLDEEEKNELKEEFPSVMEVSTSMAPFSSAETLVWDWQAIALTSAIFACVLFFLVITLYSFHQTRQWRKLKENFEADVEELSAQLSLMAAASNEKDDFGEKPGSEFVPTTIDINYLNNRCVYLEQLLSVRKEDNNIGSTQKGNVYIEEKKSKS